VIRDRLLSVHQHRARLLSRARAEREHLAATVLDIESGLSWVDALKRIGNEVRSHPLGVLAVLAVLAVLRPRGALKLIGGGWWLWRLYQRLRRVWALAAGLAASAASRT
jgi:hypothetical protein